MFSCYIPPYSDYIFFALSFLAGRHPSISDSSTARSVSSAAAAGPSAGIGAGFIGQLLLDNADTLCAAASPLLEIEDYTL